MRLKSTFRFINMVKSIIHERRIFLAQFYRDVSLLIANYVNYKFIPPFSFRLTTASKSSQGYV